MPNFFDQFDAPGSTATASGGNPFDRFDVQKPNPPGLISTIKRTGANMASTAATAVEDVTGKNPITQGVINWGKGVEERNPAGIQSLSDIANNPLLTIKEGVGNMVAQMPVTLGASALGAYGGGAVGGAIGGPPGAAAGATIGRWAGAAIPTFLQEYGGIRQDQQEAGIDDKGRALLAAVPATAIEFNPLSPDVKAIRMMAGEEGKKLFGQGGKQVAKDLGKAAAIGAVTEGPMEEYPQTLLSTWGAHKDPFTAQAQEQAAVGAVLGAVGGGAMGPINATASGIRAAKEEEARRVAAQMGVAPIAGAPATPVPPAAGTTAPAQPVAGSPSSVADTVAQAVAAEEAAANSAAMSQGGGAASPSPAAAVSGEPTPAAIDPEIIKRRAQAYYDAGKARVDEGYFDEGLHLMEQGDAILRGEQPVPFGGATTSESSNPAADPEREKRARFYESMADEREARGDTEGIIKAAEYRQTAASLRAGNPASPPKGKNESGNQAEKAVKAKKGREKKPDEVPDSAAVDVAGLSIAAPPDSRPAPARDDAVKFAESRTDGQLAVLAKSGRPGYKEAAVAEIARRSGMSPKSASGTSEKSSGVAAQENKLPASPVPAVGEPLLSGGAGNEMSAGNVGDTLPAPKAARTATTISDDEYKAIADDARYLKDIVYSIANLVGDDKKTILRLSSRLGKSGRDTILMDALNIDRDLAHTINNRLDDKQPRSLRSQDMEDAFAKFPALRRIVEEAKQGSQPVAANETAPDAPQTPLSSASETQAPRKNPGAKSNPPPIMRRDDLVGAIMRVTGGNGIHSSMAPDTVGDNANRATKLRGLFTNRGTTDLGDVAMLLRESENFDVRDGEHLAELIRQASFGDVPVSMERQERNAEADKEKQHRDRIRAMAKKYKLKTDFVKFSVLEGRVLYVERQRHKQAVNALTERDKKRFEAAVQQLEGLVSEEEVGAILRDVNERPNLDGREKWKEARRLLEQFAQDARHKEIEGAIDRAEQSTTTEEPDWFKEDDDEADTGSGNGGLSAEDHGKDGDRVQGQSEPAAGEERESGVLAGGEESGQGNREAPAGSLELTGQTQQEAAAAEAEAKTQANREAKAKQEAEKAKKEAETKSEIKLRSEAAASTFELGGDAMANLTGQGSIFDAPASPVAAEKQEEPLRSVTIGQFRHTKTGLMQYSVAFKDKVSPEIFAQAKAIASREKTRWSAFKGGGAIPGFLFASEAKAKQFAVEIDKLAKPAAAKAQEAPALADNQVKLPNSPYIYTKHADGRWSWALYWSRDAKPNFLGNDAQIIDEVEALLAEKRGDAPKNNSDPDPIGSPEPILSPKKYGAEAFAKRIRRPAEDSRFLGAYQDRIGASEYDAWWSGYNEAKVAANEAATKSPAVAEEKAAPSEDDIGALFDAAMNDVFGEVPAAPAAPALAPAPKASTQSRPGNPRAPRNISPDELERRDAYKAGRAAFAKGTRRDFAHDFTPETLAAWHSGWDAAKRDREAADRAQEQSQAPTTSPPPRPPSASAAAASAIKNAGMGLADVAKGLNALFKPKPGTLGTGLPFDEDTYAAAKPYFLSGVQHFKQAGADIAEMLKSLIVSLRDQFGMDRETIDNMKPYIVRFMGDVKAGKVAIGDDQQQKSPTMQVAEFIHGRLAAGQKTSWQDLFAAAARAWGSKMSDGKYTVKDAYDAMEAGVNLHIRSEGMLIDGDAKEASAFATGLTKLIDLLPTQTKRTAEQDEFQQFSTPPALSYVAAWVANISKADTMMEPSAGTGDLVIWAEQQGAGLILNELSPRRAAILQELFPGARVFAENAEQINNVLPADAEPTVVVMNPPFSSTAGRVQGSRNTMNGAKHIEQALKRLADGGRLVAIVGEGMAADRPAFTSWWKAIAKEYNVRANIGIDGKEYAKYGTTFSNQILVFDKTGPTTGEIVTGNVASVADLPELLEGIRNDRLPVYQRASDQQEVAVAPEGKQGANGSAPTDRGGSTDAVVPGGKSEPTTGSVGTAAVGGKGPGRGTGETAASATGEERPATVDAPLDADGERGRLPDRPVGDGAGSSGNNAGGVDVSDSGAAETSEQGSLTDSVFENYTPQRLRVAGAKPHPGNLVQSAAMASVEPPAPTYKPNLPRELIDGGKLSVAQIESIVYAGQAHEQFLPNGERRGFFIGDGTGVGKGREIAGIILDNIRQGRKKAVWVSFSEGLINDARRDFEGIGGNKDLVFWHGKTKPANEIQAKEGILFTSYSTMKSAEKKQANETGQRAGKTRLDQIVDWLGADFDGAIVFDEAHSMGNIIAMPGKRGIKKPSQQALAGANLQKMLPKARIVYVSATGATEVSNLGYASRLGLWGEKTAFPGVREFITGIAQGGVAAMELISRDMKALGMYIARSLSFDGVTYQRLDHELTPLQTDIYNELARAWQGVLKNVNEALGITGGDKNGSAKSAAMAAFWGSHQRFFNQVITSLQTPTVIDDMRKQIAAGNAIVVQLVNTNEATQEREVAKAQADGTELEELDFTPRQMLLDYVRNSFPVQAYQQSTDDQGNLIMVPVTDAAGNPVFDKDAIAMRERLLKALEQIRVPGNPIDEIIQAFGSDAVGEVTGRKRRFVSERGEDGTYRIVEEKRGKNAAHNDAAAFQGDKKKILIFSQAGGTGFSFHADNTAENKRKRVHYILQPGWRADAAVQGFGRSHRTNQASAPIYMLPTTNLKAQKRFVSSIARRLDQLGALTRGQRQATSQGMFSASDNLESQYAADALKNLFNDMYRGNSSLEFGEITGAMGLDGLIDQNGGLNTSKLPEIPQFLNRLLSLESFQQDEVFSEFEKRLDEVVNFAIQTGTYDTGLQTLRAQSIVKVRDEVAHTDPRTGAETRYVEVDVSNPIKYVTKRRAMEWANDYGSQFEGWFKDANGEVFGLAYLGERVNSDGETAYRGVILKINGERRYIDNADQVRRGWKKDSRGDKQTISTRIDDHGEAMALLDAQIKTAPKTRTKRERMIVGVILPVWDRVQGDAKIVRLQTDSGERMIGRMMSEKEAKQTVKNLGLGASVSKMSTKDVLDNIRAGSVAELANGWQIAQVTVSGEKRLEIRNRSGYFTSGDTNILNDQGAFFERIEWKERAFIPAGKDGENVFERVTESKPVVDLVSKSDRGVDDSTRYNVATDALATPADRAVYTMAGEGKSAQDILSFIGKASRRPFNRYLANALRNLGAASTLTLDSQGGWRFGNTSQAQRYAAAYNPKTDTVALFTARDAERHTLHELIHAATLKAIAAGGPASLQMRAMFLHIKRNGSLDGQYGMSNLDEFVAEAFSNPKFQAALKAIPAPKGSTLKNAWEWFVRMVANALGFKTAPMRTALDEAMTLGAKLMRENAALSGEVEGVRGSAALPDTITINGIERPTTNSKGQPIHPTEEGVRNFYKWFGDSKVVDEQGRPLVVYHFTNNDIGGTFKQAQRKARIVDQRTGEWARLAGDGIYYFATEQNYPTSVGWGRTKFKHAVYLRLINKKLITREESDRLFVDDDLSESIKENGHDGTISDDGKELTVFNSIQIKSATGNSGQFDPENPDIRYSAATDWYNSQSGAPVRNAWQAAKAKAAEILSPKNLDKIIYEMQDKYVDLKRLRDHIKAIGGTITDMNDAYLGEELYHQRLAYRTEKFAADELLPLQAEMRAKGISQSELETFLHARHAPEANAEMAKRNPNQSEIDAGRNQAADAVRDLELQLQRAKATGAATHAIERALNDARGELSSWNGAQAFRGTEEERTSLSGMSDAEAAAIMAGLTPKRRADLDALAARVDAINEGTLQLLDDYGLMPKAALTAWRNTYQHYIPLHRDEAHPDSLSHPIGQGFNVKGDAAKRRTGSNQKVTNILGHIAMQREAALTRGEKNHVMLKLYLMARQNPLPDVWKVGSVPTIDTIDKATGFVKSVPDPLYKTRPNVLVLRVGGKDVAITINEHNPEALRMAHALKNLDVDDLHYLIPVVGKATRWFASMNTQYNPIFGIINLMRDTQEAALNLSTTELAGKQGEILKDQLSILKEVLQNKGRMPKTGKWAALFAELKEVGGTTGYRDLFLDAESRGKALQDTLKSLDRGKASQAAHAVAEWLSDYNEAMENATRLAAYKAGIDSGMSKERAASLAKNLTVNFNRKGRQTRELGALYAFFNAAVQGTTRMAQTLAGPAGRKIMAGGVLLGALNALLGIAMMGGGDGDDDEWEKIPEFVKERSIIIPIGKQDYLSIPMPLGFQFLPNIGRLAVEMAVYKDKTAGKQMASLFTVLADAFNPLGGSSPPMQIIAPTVMDPFVALAQNKDWTGRPIYIENRNNLDPKPGLQRSKDSATPWAKGLAEAINAITGGTEYTPGGWSPTPDQIDYVIGQLTGGVGREAGKVASTLSAPLTGEELPAHKIPLAGRLYGSTSGTSGQSARFYENITRANAAESEIKGRARDGLSVAEYLRENPGAVELAVRGNAAEKQVSALRKMRRDAVKQGGPEATGRVRDLNERMAAVMRDFNNESGKVGRRAEQ